MITPPTAMPKLTSDKYDSGKREALRAIYNQYFTLDGDALATLHTVLNGSAPVEFKQGFAETFEAICATLDRA